MYLIWENKPKDWMRKSLPTPLEKKPPILLFETKRQACKYAIKAYGFDTYLETKRKGFCKIVEMSVRTL